MMNRYMIQRVDHTGYRRSNRAECNRLVESGRAHWIGSDLEDDGSVTHYADRST